MLALRCAAAVRVAAVVAKGVGREGRRIRSGTSGVAGGGGGSGGAAATERGTVVERRALGCGHVLPSVMWAAAAAVARGTVAMRRTSQQLRPSPSQRRFPLKHPSCAAASFGLHRHPPLRIIASLHVVLCWNAIRGAARHAVREPDARGYRGSFDVGHSPSCCEVALAALAVGAAMPCARAHVSSANGQRPSQR